MIDTLHKLYIHQLKDLYSAEKQISEALPGMINKAKSDKLRDALANHFDETKEQLKRIDDLLIKHDIADRSETCEAIKGIIKEGEHLMTELAGDATDAGLIAAAQRVEHYEIAAYGTSKEYADELRYSNDKSELDKTLEEEANANELLTKIAVGGLFTSGVNDLAEQTP